MESGPLVALWAMQCAVARCNASAVKIHLPKGPLSGLQHQEWRGRTQERPCAGGVDGDPVSHLRETKNPSPYSVLRTKKQVKIDR
jgi:hypothetical protein